MNARIMRVVAAATLATGLLVSAGCVRVELPNPAYSTTTENVQLQGAEEVRASFEMGAGQLSIDGGGTGLMDAKFGYSDSTWEPVVEYGVDGGRGDLSVKSPNAVRINLGRNMRFEWDIELAEGVPYDLSVEMGAGESTLDLSGLDVRNLQVDLGAGESTIDLSGEWANDLDASINAGVGALRLKVPENVGVRITGYQDGIGEYRADGFSQDGEALVNDAYDTADVKFEIRLARGIGEVTVETVR